jgi:hypothetical protein
MKALWFALFLFSFSAHAETAHEYTLKIAYDVSCPNQTDSAFPGLTGSVIVRNRILRLDLFKYTHSAEVALSFPTKPDLSELVFDWDPSNDCTLKNLTPTIVDEDLDGMDSFQALALKHSPYLVIRKDQVLQRQKDLPLSITYSVMPTRRGTQKIRYTIFFSNETVHGLFSTTKAASLAHYGRRTDIEWMYDVEFDDQFNVVSRKYQSGIIGGFGHATKNFKGSFIPGTQHPILFNIAAHNVFGSKGDFGPDRMPIRDGYHFVPRDEIPDADAREWWQWNRPWIFDLSDRELRRGQGRSGEFQAASNEYLYVLLTGKMNKSRLRLNFATETFFIRSGKVSKLGEGLWGKQTFTAIKMSEEEQNHGGQLSMFRLKRGLIIRHWGFLDLDPLKFYRLRPDAELGYTMLDVSDQFRCNEDFECTYGLIKPASQDQSQTQASNP